MSRRRVSLQTTGLGACAALVAASAIAACATTDPCPPREPARMPNGSETKTAARSASGAANVMVWRSGESYVIQRIFLVGASGEPECPPGHLAGATDCLVADDLQVRGQPAILEAGSGNEQWLVAWVEAGCTYETVFGPLARPEAEAYAAGY